MSEITFAEAKDVAPTEATDNSIDSHVSEPRNILTQKVFNMLIPSKQNMSLTNYLMTADTRTSI